MEKKLIESHFKLFRKTIQLYNFYKNIKEKGTSKGIIDTQSIEDVLQEAREINQKFSEFPKSEKPKQ